VALDPRRPKLRVALVFYYVPPYLLPKLSRLIGQGRLTMTGLSSQDRDVPPPYFSVSNEPPPAEGLSAGDAAPRTITTPPSTLTPDPRGRSPPPSYDAAVTSSPTPTAVVSPRRGRFSLLPSSSRTAAPVPTAPPTEEALLASIFDVHRWPRTWGLRPKTLHHALVRASLFGAAPLVRALLAAGANIRFTSKYAASRGTSAVHEALRGPAPELAITLISHFFSASYAAALSPGHPDRPIPDADEGRAMEVADAETRYLLDARDGKGCTPLHLAAQAGETEIVGEMVLRGSDVDAEDDLGRTPLLMAARYNRLETVRFLLQSGADASKIREDLWVSAGSEKEELGSYGLISQLLGDIMTAGEDSVDRTGQRDRDRGLELGRHSERHAQFTKDPHGDVTLPTTCQRPPTVPDAKAPIPDEPHHHGSGSCSSTSVRSSRNGPNAFSSQSSESWANQPILCPEIMSVLTSSLSSLGRSTPRIRRPPPSMWNSPEYEIWRRDCEVLQAEHRGQKERNRRSGAV